MRECASSRYHLRSQRPPRRTLSPRRSLLRSERTGEALRTRGDALQRQLGTARPTGGASPLLVLRDATRGTPEVSRARQAPADLVTTIVLSYPFDRWIRENADGRCMVTITRLPDAAPVWTADLPVRELWSAEHRLGVLAVPGRVLIPGRYVLRVVPVRGGPRSMSAEFEITASLR